MTRIRVWAPEARRVQLESGGRRLEMIAHESGWWSVDAPFITHGVDYAFRVDGDGPFPDPRAPWQPGGVDGPSRWVDHGRFSWSDGGWQQVPLESAVIYELHVGTFSPEGTFDGTAKRLDHLAGLGVTHVELMPVAEFSGRRGWGYDGVDLYAPHHAYGGPEGLKRLVDACHRRGLAVLLDVVYNHLGPAGNHLGRFGPYFTGRYATPWGEAVNLDGPGSDEVRRFFIENALMWLEDYHGDGLRIDAVHAFLDTSAVHFLEELAGEVGRLQARLGRHLVLIAESALNDPRVVRPPETGGYGLDAQWNEDFHHALHALLTGERNGYYRDFGRLADLAATLTRGFAYDGRYSAYRRRRHGRPAGDLPAHRFVGCLQNHDQVGNRALGERTGRLLSPEKLKIGAALVMTAPFVPMLFQGEEWGASSPFLYFTDHGDPELAEAVRIGRRREFAAFGWDPAVIPDPQAEETFLRSRLDWGEPAREPHRDLLAWHRSLIELRHRIPDLTDGRFSRVTVNFDERDKWLTMTRGSVLVACNFGERDVEIPRADPGEREIALASSETVTARAGGIRLPGPSVAIMTGNGDNRRRKNEEEEKK
ncbi:MAG TPA: malto-oligosyltrehalose trehalohydrolase [Syntrophales bacterium]|nr:malto-oligosyltrehalose trehalohydrolase [Syntrophales bacterium]